MPIRKKEYAICESCIYHQNFEDKSVPVGKKIVGFCMIEPIVTTRQNTDHACHRYDSIYYMEGEDAINTD